MARGCHIIGMILGCNMGDVSFYKILPCTTKSTQPSITYSGHKKMIVVIFVSHLAKRSQESTYFVK